MKGSSVNGSRGHEPTPSRRSAGHRTRPEVQDVHRYGRTSPGPHHPMVLNRMTVDGVDRDCHRPPGPADEPRRSWTSAISAHQGRPGQDDAQEDEADDGQQVAAHGPNRGVRRKTAAPVGAGPALRPRVGSGGDRAQGRARGPRSHHRREPCCFPTRSTRYGQPFAAATCLATSSSGRVRPGQLLRPASGCQWSRWGGHRLGDRRGQTLAGAGAG